MILSEAVRAIHEAAIASLGIGMVGIYYFACRDSWFGFPVPKKGVGHFVVALCGALVVFGFAYFYFGPIVAWLVIPD